MVITWGVIEKRKEKKVTKKRNVGKKLFLFAAPDVRDKDPRSQTHLLGMR
jgi:hypothetical protein